MVATYELHDRVLSNRASRRRYSRSVPQLDDVQSRILAQLDAEGYAQLDFQELFTDSTTWHEIDAWGGTFIADTESELAREATGEEADVVRRAGKEFVIRKYDRERRSSREISGSASARRDACSISPTRTCACGRSSSTSTSGTRHPQPSG